MMGAVKKAAAKRTAKVYAADGEEIRNHHL